MTPKQQALKDMSEDASVSEVYIGKENQIFIEKEGFEFLETEKNYLIKNYDYEVLCK